MSDKVRLHLRLTPETHRLIGEYAQKDNCTTLNEFVEHAVEFYVGYLSAEDCLRFLPPSLAAAVRGTIQDTENHICRLLFKLAVELDMMMNVLASELDVGPGSAGPDARTVYPGGQENHRLHHVRRCGQVSARRIIGHASDHIQVSPHQRRHSESGGTPRKLGFLCCYPRWRPVHCA